jgi:hypothetical protein
VNVFFIHGIALILQHGPLGIKRSVLQLAKNKTEYFDYFSLFFLMNKITKYFLTEKKNFDYRKRKELSSMSFVSAR